MAPQIDHAPQAFLVFPHPGQGALDAADVAGRGAVRAVVLPLDLRQGPPVRFAGSFQGAGAGLPVPQGPQPDLGPAAVVEAMVKGPGRPVAQTVQHGLTLGPGDRTQMMSQGGSQMRQGPPQPVLVQDALQRRPLRLVPEPGRQFVDEERRGLQVEDEEAPFPRRQLQSQTPPGPVRHDVQNPPPLEALAQPHGAARRILGILGLVVGEIEKRSGFGRAQHEMPRPPQAQRPGLGQGREDLFHAHAPNALGHLFGHETKNAGIHESAP